MWIANFSGDRLVNSDKLETIYIRYSNDGRCFVSADARGSCKNVKRTYDLYYSDQLELCEGFIDEIFNKLDMDG